MKKILLLFILSLFPILAFSQTEIMYDYDYAGNRIKREIMMIVQKSQTKKQALNQLEFYTDKVNSHLIKIYPNPTRGELRVCISNFISPDQCRVELYSLQGDQLINRDIKMDVLTFDISNQPNGIYLLKITINKSITTWKIIKI